MAHERSLPKRRNPLLAPDSTPPHEELAGKRRLGQTHLAVKPGQVGTSNATKPENLGTFDYAHLRAPLPTNLKGSEIFHPGFKQAYPEAYFLMRRSLDGYVSATGMFRASFPWAKAAEEHDERTYLKSVPSTSHDEVAGNVWIPEEYALELAEDYGILPWIEALVDDGQISTTAEEKKKIASPPKFVFKANTGNIAYAVTPRGRGRPRAGSPIKGGKASQALPSPRKRITKKAKEENALAARQASESLQDNLDRAASMADTASVNGEASVVAENHVEDAPEKHADAVEKRETANEKHHDEKVMVEVDSAVEVNGDTETTHTTVKVEMPFGSPDLPLPEDTAAMISKAKEMVEEARKLEGESSGAGKRKAEVLDDTETDEERDAELQPAKRARLLQQDLKVQRVRNRALVGIAATMAIGAIIPFIF